MRGLVKIGALLSSLTVIATPSWATGTTAGTSIANQATLTYDAGAGTVSAQSNTVTVKVDELVRATVLSQDSSKQVAVSAGDTNQVLKFQLSNTGNGSEAFQITAANLTGDDFDTGSFTIYMDATGNGNEGDFDIATDTLLSGGLTPELAADESIVLWIVTDIPAVLTDGDKADVQMVARSNTFVTGGNNNPNTGDVIANAGDGNTNAVYGSTGIIADNASFVMSAIAVTMTKAISEIRDNLGQNGSQPVPGAEVDYVLTVSVTGSGTANSVVVSDPLPAELALQGGINGTITVNGSDLTATSLDSDNASYDANTNTITVNLGSVASGNTTTIEFTTIIQ